MLILKQMDQERMNYLCSIFTFLWTIWNHRNMVTHDGKTLNPTEVILTAQTLTCRFKEAFEKDNHDRPWENHTTYQNIGGSWELLIKIAGARKNRPRRTAFSSEATNLQGRIMFSGSASNGAFTTTAATQEALVEAAIKAKNLVFYRILIMCCIKRIVHVCNMQCSPNWQEKTMLSDMLSLQQQGLCCKAFFVPGIFLSIFMNPSIVHLIWISLNPTHLNIWVKWVKTH